MFAIQGDRFRKNCLVWFFFLTFFIGSSFLAVQPAKAAYDLIANPLPFSVSIGIDCDGDDPPELCKFHGFYPIIIWDLEQQASQNPVDLVISELEKTTPSSPKSAADATKKCCCRL